MSHGDTKGGGFVPPSPEELDVILDSYEFLELLGRGGMGAVYKARQKSLDRLVAIKILPPGLTDGKETGDGFFFAERFQREARAMAKLSHPNIISVFDFGTTHEGHLFFVMELVDGANLSEIIRGPGLDPNQALVIAGQVCTALAYAHAKGVVHRDIKPANVMVSSEGVAKVADFGLARLTGPNPEEFGHTVTGTVMGTPEYMSPEQKHGMAVDHRADIFSLGVMLYEMLCKEPPQGAFEPPSERAGCDAGIDKIVLKAMHRTPEGRYQSTVQMKADLDAAWQRQMAGTPLAARSPQHLHPPRASSPGAHRSPYPASPRKSRGGLIVALVIAALAGAGIFYSSRKDRETRAKLAVQSAKAEKSAPLSTPVPIPSAPPVATVPESAPNVIPGEASAKVKPNDPQDQTLSGPKDLLADVNLARGGRPGQWQMTPEGVRVRPDGDGSTASRLSFEYAPPAEYDFEVEFTILDGRREVAQVLPIGDTTILWRMGYGHGDPALFCFGENLDQKNPADTGRTDAVARLPRLKLNQRYRALVEVHRDWLRASIDGNEVLRWSGELKRLSMEDGTPRRDPRNLEVAAWGSSVLFHTAFVRPPGNATLPPPPRAKPPDASKVAVLPATSNLVAASKDPRLIQLEATFMARFDTEAQKPYLASVTTLNGSYLANGLTRIRLAAVARGDLDEVTAIDAERLVVSRGEGVPDLDAAGTPNSLQTLRTAYRAAMDKYTATRTKAAAQLYDLYLASLDGYIRELTRANRIEHALKVKTVREDIAAQKAEILRSEPTQPAPASGASVPAARAIRAGSARDAAAWILASGGKCNIAKGSLEAEVLAERQIPAGKFEILGFSLDRRDPKHQPLPASDFQILKGIGTLRMVWIHSPALDDAAFDFLADNAELSSVSLHTSNLTDDVLNHLGAARKLTEIALVSSRNFTGKGLEKMRWLPVLTTADFSGSGVTDEGLKALLGAPKLRSLSLNGGVAVATDAGLAAVADHRALDALMLDGCKGFTDAGFASLARLKTLRALSATNTSFGDYAANAFAGHREIRELKLRGTAITDAGLTKLATLSKLETLDLNGTNVTPAGIEAFRRSVPKCQLVW